MVYKNQKRSYGGWPTLIATWGKRNWGGAWGMARAPR